MLVGVLAGVGCSDHGDDATRGSSATVRTEPATTTTSVVPVDQVPAVIDVAYVQRVIDALDHVMGDAVRALVAAKAPDRAFYERLRAVYLDPEFERVQAELGRAAAEELTTIRLNPGDPIARVERMISASPNCIFVAAFRSLEPLFTRTPAESETRGFLGLKRRDDSRDPKKLNPTAWTIALDGVRPDGSEPRSPC